MLSTKRSDTLVVLIDYHGLDDTIECVHSIRKSTVCVDIFIVDNASSGDVSHHFENDNDIIVVESSNNGFAAGNNIGIRYALDYSYEFIVLLNNDTIVERRLIETMKERCTKNNVVSPKILYYDAPSTIWFGGGMIDARRGNAYHLNSGKPSECDTDPFFCTFATGCCIMLHSESVRAVGMMDEEYFMYVEDADYSIRLALAGIRIEHVPNAVLWHKVSSSTGGERSAFSTYYVTRNRLHLICKHSSYFSKTAMPYALASRYVWALRLLMVRDSLYTTFIHAIKDFKSGKMGQQPI